MSGGVNHQPRGFLLESVLLITTESVKSWNGKKIEFRSFDVLYFIIDCIWNLSCMQISYLGNFVYYKHKTDLTIVTIHSYWLPFFRCNHLEIPCWNYGKMHKEADLWRQCIRNNSVSVHKMNRIYVYKIRSNSFFLLVEIKIRRKIKFKFKKVQSKLRLFSIDFHGKFRWY